MPSPLPSPTMSPAPPPHQPPPPPSGSPAALAALLAQALADVDRLKQDLDATARRAAAAENVLRALAPPSPDDSHNPHHPELSQAALATLLQAESRAGAAEARLQTVLDAWADLLRTEERAAEERKRIDDDARAARRALYPAAPGGSLRAAAPATRPRHQFPAATNGTTSAHVSANNSSSRIRPRTSSDLAHPTPVKRARNNNWSTDRPPSPSPDSLAGPGHGIPPPEQLQQHPHAISSHTSQLTHGPRAEPSVEDLLLETVERPPRPSRPAPLEQTLTNVPAPAADPKTPIVVRPPVAPGTRTCRQCGQPGRYKDGKCVEKWGPGPEGPGTVCDRCRKKMKRVERRGDSNALVVSAPVPTAQAAPASISHASQHHLHATPHSPPPTFSPLPPAPNSPPSTGSRSGSAPTDDIASSRGEDGEGEEVDGEGERGEVEAEVDVVKREGEE